MQQSLINIVLYQPEIPQNTGNIARMCVANDLHLHLIEPLGFELSDKYLKRSGLDYWQYIKYTVYSSWQDFISRHPEEGEARRQDPDWIATSLTSFAPRNDKKLWYLTTKTDQVYWDVKFREGDFLVFGPETKGLPMELMKQDWAQTLTVPMFGEHARSLNLASTVQTVAYEALRQIAPCRKTFISPSI